MESVKNCVSYCLQRYLCFFEETRQPLSPVRPLSLIMFDPDDLEAIREGHEDWTEDTFGPTV
ncbi:hypothetical protein KY092_12710, partial [Natronomonas gomsonensis]|uniref:hypothetical protein n=1 Tax=Natronomonas gomsonensis TaxID=1046043 RepID=UPI00227A2D7B